MTREVSPAIATCQLTHVNRAPIDYATAVAQHRLYQRCLTDLGCTVHLLPADDTMPDSVFIEDTAVVVDELAVIARPGAESRRSETTAVADVLRRYRPVARLGPPGTLDGGDVLEVFRGKHVIEVDPTEPFAANALRVGDALVYSSAFPRTRRRLEASGIEPRLVDATELAKAEGGVTCCSLLFSG